MVWLKWKRAIKVLHDRMITTKRKGKFYGTTIRLAVLYESEHYATTV